MKFSAPQKKLGSITGNSLKLDEKRVAFKEKRETIVDQVFNSLIKSMHMFIQYSEEAQGGASWYKG